MHPNASHLLPVPDCRVEWRLREHEPPRVSVVSVRILVDVEVDVDLLPVHDDGRRLPGLMGHREVEDRLERRAGLKDRHHDGRAVRLVAVSNDCR